MCLLILPPHSVQLSLKNSYEKHAYVYEACHTKCPLLPRKRQYIRLYGVYKFPILYCVCESYIPIWYYIYDAWQGLQFSISFAARNPSCPKVMAVTTGIITHFSFCAVASLYSPPCLHEICLHPAVREYIYQVQTKLFSGWWFWNECPLLDLSHQPRMCAHIRANPLILPPVLLSISGGSRVVGVDGCWQDQDCWGKDDGSSCSDRIAVSWDPLEGVIRLFWELLPLLYQRKWEDAALQSTSIVSPFCL